MDGCFRCDEPIGESEWSTLGQNGPAWPVKRRGARIPRRALRAAYVPEVVRHVASSQVSRVFCSGPWFGPATMLSELRNSAVLVVAVFRPWRGGAGCF